jgi:hypothetical protein
MRFPNFVGPTYQYSGTPGLGSGLLSDAEDCINWWPEAVESAGGRVRYKYRRTPGLGIFATLPKTPIRGIFAGENRLFAVAGNSFYEIFSNGTFTDRSALGGASFITNDGFPCDLAYNGTQVLIAGGGLAWCDNGAGPQPANFTGGGQVSAVRCGYLDGYFWAQKGGAVNNTNSNQFFLSALQDGTTWDPLQFASKSAFPDNVSAIFADHEEMWIFGDEGSTEVWANNQQVQPQFPFQRNPSAIINLGCRAPFSVARLGNGLAWLAGDQLRGGVFVAHAEGYRWKRISTHPLETFWANFSAAAGQGNSPLTATAYTEIRNGHEMYVLTMPGFGTWVYDLATQMWHKRASVSAGGAMAVYSRVAFQAWVNLGTTGSAWYGGGGFNNDGNIYLVDMIYLNEPAGSITRTRQAPYIAESLFSVFHHRLRLLVQTNFGNGGGAITTNHALKWSDDGGQTFSTPLTVQAPSGVFMAPVEWGGAAAGAGGLGVSPRGRIYNYQNSDAADIELLDADIEVSGGRY